jgi:hypothetical protein
MGVSKTPKPIHPREKYVSQYHFFSTSQNMHDCPEKRIQIAKFGSSGELLDVAKQRNQREPIG